MAERWFKGAGPGKGDRTLAEQIIGLNPLFAEVTGKTVLDIGCAEGLIGIECAKRGAASVLGVEIVERHVDIARRLAGNLPCRFEVGDLGDLGMKAVAGAKVEQHDVVLSLAVLHKLTQIAPGARFVADSARSLAVIRYPAICPNGVIVDSRSSYRPFDVPKFMAGRGFKLERTETGPRRERTDYFRRIG